MKKIFILAIFVVISTTLSFAQVNDNTGPAADGKHSGSGTFGATLLQPLQIDCITPFVNLGEFVKAPTLPYNSDLAPTQFTEALMEFTITGEPWHTFYVTIEPSLSNSVADIKIRTYLAVPMQGTFIYEDPYFIISGNSNFSDILDDNGSYMFTLECYEVTAKDSGEGLFEQTVTVSYNL